MIDVQHFDRYKHSLCQELFARKYSLLRPTYYNIALAKRAFWLANTLDPFARKCVYKTCFSSQSSREYHIIDSRDTHVHGNTCCRHKMAVTFINPSLDPRITVYCSYMYVWRELSKRVLLQTFQEDCTWLNRLWGKQWSVIQRTSKYVTVTLDTDEERINVPYLQTYRWKEKLAVLMLPRFQGSLQTT